MGEQESTGKGRILAQQLPSLCMRATWGVHHPFAFLPMYGGRNALLRSLIIAKIVSRVCGCCATLVNGCTGSADGRDCCLLCTEEGGVDKDAAGVDSCLREGTTAGGAGRRLGLTGADGSRSRVTSPPSFWYSGCCSGPALTRDGRVI